MKNLLLLLCVTAWSCLVQAQQFPQSTQQILQMDDFNPATSSADSLFHLRLNAQQRTKQGAGLRSGSQFLRLIGKVQGRREVFGWGLSLANDFEHTEQRLSFAPTLSATVLRKQHTDLSLGIMVGFISWSSDYSRAAVYHPEDPVGVNKVNFMEVNAGLGFKLRHRSEKLRVQLGAWGNQLSGGMISEQLEGLRVYPHVLGEADLLMGVSEELFVGPRAYFKNTLFIGDTSIAAGQVDIGLAAEMPGKELWASLSYRSANSAISAGLGFPLIPKNPAASPYANQNRLDMNLGFSYPLTAAEAFGPAIEIGLHWSFGKQSHLMDTLRLAKNFWDNQALLIMHKQMYLDSAGPHGLNGNVYKAPKHISLYYDYPDLSFRYLGDAPDVRDSLVRKIGYEWMGNDALIQYLIQKVTQHALFPDTVNLKDPENLEPLLQLTQINFSCQLRVDEIGAHMGSEMPYLGEFGTNNPTEDTLFLSVVFDGLDTVLALVPQTILTNLELATLKLYALRAKAHYELERHFGDEFWIYVQDKSMTLDAVEGFRRRINLGKLRVTSDNPNLQAFQQNEIEMKFIRYKRYWEKDGWIDRKDENGNWIEEEPIRKKGDKRKKKEKKDS